MSRSTSPLDDLRRRIDEIDDQLHDLLMRRAEVVEAVAASKKTDAVPALRPGREALILRRLVGRHAGRFPRPILVRIWRELLSGTIGMQGEFAVAVYAAEQAPGIWDLARDHFGSHTPMLAYRSHGEVLRAVTEGRAMIGVLPMPEEGARDPWWRLLVATDLAAPRVIARLPFAGRGNARSEGGDALVIGGGEAERTGADRSLLVIETSGEVSRARLIGALAGAGLAPTFFAGLAPSGSLTWNLVEIDDFVAVDDSRLLQALAPLGDKAGRVYSLGSYARPFAPADLAGTTGE
jgi:chorismate mutase